MFERYRDEAKRAIFFARYEALQHGSRHIETEHLLLGLLYDEKSLIEEIFKLREQSNNFRALVKSSGAALGKDANLPLSKECKRVLVYTAEEAERLGRHWIEAEHLLLGLLREKGTNAAKMLAGSGISLKEARIAVANYRGTHPRTELPPIVPSFRLSMWVARLIPLAFIAVIIYIAYLLGR